MEESSNADAANEDGSTAIVTKIKQEHIEPEDMQISEEYIDESDLVQNNNHDGENGDGGGGGGGDYDEEQQEQADDNGEDEGDYEVDLECDTNGLIDTELTTPTGGGEVTTTSGETTSTTTAGSEPKKTGGKVIDLKARPRQTRYEREKLYKLPSTAHIVVHPSATAKGGKFNCHLASLSSMLEYTKEYNRECSFEVFLFAECFNDMLMRDQAFVIFKHLLSIGNSCDAAPPANKRKLSTEESQVSASSGATGGSTTAASKKPRTGKEDESNETASESAKSASVSTSTGKTLSKPKTIYTDLLLAFTYFDVNRTSHIMERDLEDMLLRFGPLNLTRSKVRVLTKKMQTPVREGLYNYRTLTDRTASGIMPPTICYNLPSDDEIVHYALNFDAFVRRLQALRGGDTSSSSSSSGNVTVCSTGDADAILVEVNGTVIDVASTLKKLEKAQTDLHAFDLKLKEALDEIGNLPNFYFLIKRKTLLL